MSSVLTRHLGTLTSTISGYADLLVDAQNDQEQRDIAMNLLEASTRIDDLLADLRHYSRSLEPAPRVVSVPETTKGAVQLLSDSERARVCKRVEPPAAGEIEADPRLLRQALLNLLQNALEASEETEDVLLRATADDTASLDTTVAFEIWNDGEIPVDDPAELFQPFYSTRPQRLGLGLPIAAHIADQHGGTVQLTENSAADGGTCFTLRV
ncbi:MAG: sensor histidine kinase [Salinibacter sp.]